MNPEVRKEGREISSYPELTIWTEKYRPREFEDVVGQDEIVKRARAFVASKNMPHLMFAGPAGCGKTTLALIVAKKLFGKNWHENFLELNASDERGIDVVRQKVKSFARTKSFEAPFKIIFLDESDALTKEAQQALRRTMEMFTSTCRFILSCNVSSKIIDPIQSRCSVFRFKLLAEKDVETIVEKICKGEKLKVDDKAIDAIYEISNGDCRRIINLLHASASVSNNITEQLIYKIVSSTKPADILDIMNQALKGQFLESRDKLLDVMLKQGLGGLDVLKAMQKEIWNLQVPEQVKVKLIEKCGEIEFRLVEGSDEFIQLESLLASFVMAK